MSSVNYENQILDAIQTIVNNAVETAGYDRTIKASIVKCEDITMGRYVVKYQNSSFYAYSANETKYSDGSMVYVLVPGNDMRQTKTILGTVDALGLNYTSAAETEYGYEVKGNNVITSENGLSLCSYESAQIKTLYDYNSDNNTITLDEQGAQLYSKNAKYIICGASFKTSLSTEQKSKGDYGICFDLDFTDNGTGNTITKTYIVNVDKMSGNPYNFTKETRQVCVFEADGDNFVRINKIYIYERNFPKAEDGHSDDIFISSVELDMANELSPQEIASNGLTLLTPKGAYFDDTNTDNDTKIINARVRIKGNIVNSDANEIAYYWFKENNTIDGKSNKYNRYGGTGWECLNAFNETTETNDEGEEITFISWIPSGYSYETLKSNNIAKENKYKCVAIYGEDIVLSKEVIIYNLSSQYEITIESDCGTNFYYDLGYPTLTCKINGNSVPNNYTYVWSVVDNYNNFTALPETEERNLEYNTAKDDYDSLLAQLKNESVLSGAVSEQLNDDLEIINSYEKVTRIEKNIIYKLHVNTINAFSIYKCSVYNSENKFIGTASITLTNSLTNTNDYSIIITEGEQIFKYNENGIAPNNKSIDNPQIIYPLSFKLFDEEGNEVDKNAILLSDISWVVPSKNTLIKIDSIYTPTEERETENVYSGYSELNFDIEQTYNAKKSNNTIQLIVKYKNKIISAVTNLTFTKTGEIGTNGTDYICKIVPNTANGSVLEDYPMITIDDTMAEPEGVLNYLRPQGQSNNWFKVQLWHDGVKIFDNIGSGTTQEETQAEVKWEVLKNKYDTTHSDDSNIIVSESGAFSIDTTAYSNPANIVKCNVLINGVNYYATMPVIVARIKDDDYQTRLLPNTGYSTVMYTTDGQTPAYNNDKPFTLEVKRKINNIVEDVSILEKDFRVNYDWSVLGETYRSDWQSETNLIKEKAKNLSKERNEIYYKPFETFDGLCVTNGLKCAITDKDNNLGCEIYIPVHLYLNRYGNSAMNGWDGNSINIDEENSLILAPQVGAGTKTTDNGFTGVFMGQVQEADKEKAEYGLYGYNNGERTIALNAEDGSARFGKTGSGQIIIDPSSNEAIIKSGNYSEVNKTGLEINLSAPTIKYGSGNFSVDKNGYLTVRGMTTTVVDSEGNETTLEELENSIQPFDVIPYSTGIFIPADTKQYPIASKTYEVLYDCFYKGSKLTSGVTVKNTSGSISGITTDFTTYGKMKFTVSAESKINELTNNYEISFEYSGRKVTKTITVTLTLQGEDGEVINTFIRYSANADGSNMTEDPQDDSYYIGIASTKSEIAPVTPSSYKWSLYRGSDGYNGYTILLSNEALILQSDSQGGSVDYSNAETSIIVYQGTTNITLDEDVAIVTTPSNVTGNLIKDTENNCYKYKASNLSAKNGYVDFSISKASVQIGYARFTLAKAVAGSNGTTYYITPSASSIIKEGSAELTPSELSFGSYYIPGSQADAKDYVGRWLIESTEDGDTWTVLYKSTVDESYVSVTPTINMKVIRAYLGVAGKDVVKTKALDFQSIPILSSSDDIVIGGTNLLSIDSIDSTTNKSEEVSQVNNVISIKDANGGKLNSNIIYGNSEQETRNGDNLITLKDIPNGTSMGLTKIINNSILVLNGTSSGSGNIIINTPLNISLPAGDYIFSLTSESTFTIPNPGQGNDMAFYLRDMNGTSIAPLTISKLNSSNNYHIYIKFTLSELTDLYLQIYINASGIIFNNTKFKCQVVNGSTDKNFEQYGVMPSPDYPSEVKTVKGITNLFDKNNNIKLNYNLNETGLITPSNAGVFVQEKYISVKPNTKYTISTSAGNYKRIGMYTSDKTWISRALSGASDTIYTFTTTSNCYYIRLGCSINDLDNLMLEEGSVAHSYVPYGTWLEEKTTGKNMLNIQGIVKGRLDNGVIGYTGNVTNLTLNDDSFSFTTDENYRGVASDYIIVEQGNYIFNSNNLNSAYGCVIASYDSNKNWLSNLQSTAVSTQTTRTFTIPSGVKYVRLHFYLNSSGTITIENPQIEKGTIATDYESYKEHTSLIDMNKYDDNGNIVGYHELCKIGDIQDTYKDGVITKRIGKVVLNGSENWAMNYGTGMFHMSNLFKVKNTNSRKSVSSHFKYNSVNSGIYDTLKDGEFAIQYYNSSTALFLKNMNFTTINDFKTWLSDNNVTIYYILAETYEINISYEDMELFDGYNNITLESNLDTNFKIDYNRGKCVLEDFKYTQTSYGVKPYEGLYIKHNMFEDGVTYALSYKFEILEGNVTTIGGYGQSDNYELHSYLIDGVQYDEYEAANPISPDSNIHTGIFIFTYHTPPEGGTENYDLYICPNYLTASEWKVKIYNLKIERGNITTDWSPASEDLRTNITNLYCYTNGISETPMLPDESNKTQLTKAVIWSDSPDFQNTGFLWQTTRIDSQGETIYGKPVCIGSPRIKSVYNEFLKVLTANKDSKPSQTDPGWTDTKPIWDRKNDKYSLWTRIVTIYEGVADTIYSEPYLDTTWNATTDLNSVMTSVEDKVTDITSGKGTVTIEGSKLTIKAPNGQDAMIINEQGIVFNVDGKVTTAWSIGGQIASQYVTAQHLSTDLITNNSIVIGSNYKDTQNTGAFVLRDKNDITIFSMAAEATTVKVTDADGTQTETLSIAEGLRVANSSGFVHTIISKDSGIIGKRKSSTGTEETLFQVSGDRFNMNKGSANEAMQVGGVDIIKISNSSNQGIGFIKA